MPQREQEARPPTQDLLAGLYGYKIPVAFLVHRRALGGVSFALGTWAEESRSASASALDSRQRLVEAALDSTFAATETVPLIPEGALQRNSRS